MKGLANKYIVFFLIAFFAFPLITTGQEVILHGSAPNYKGAFLEFYTYSDWITKETTPLGSTTVDEQGNFECRFTIDHTQKIFLDLGVYKAFLYVEPESSYQLVLPGKNEKTRAQKLNPYFEGIPYHIGIKNTNKNELNLHLYRFLKEHKNIINKNVKKIYSSTRILDSLVEYLDTVVEFENEFFNQFKTYKNGELRITANGGSYKIKRKLFNDKNIHYFNPAYMELFNEVFNNYLSEYYSQYGNAVFAAVNYQRSLSKLDSALQKDTLLTEQPQLREFVMLKGLHDAYYSKDFNKKAIIELVDTFSVFTANPYHNQIAKNIYKKITKLRKGYEPPDFCLYDRDSNLVCLDSLKGEYIYLGFCNSMNYTCMRHFKILKNLYEKHKTHFKIVMISTEDSFETMKRNLPENKYPWTILHYGNQPEVLKQYNIRVMPSYFFITPDGELTLSPAPDPAEKIEWEIFKLMRKRGDL